MTKPTLEFVTRDLGDHIVAIGHVVTKDLRTPTMSMGDIQVVKHSSNGIDTFIDVTISKKTNPNFCDSHGYKAQPSDDMTAIPKNSIWRSPVVDLKDTLLGQFVALDTHQTKRESESEALSQYNRCIITSVLKNSTDISMGREHVFWSSIESTESDYGYHFRMKSNVTNLPVFVLERNGDTLDEQFRGTCLSGIMRTCIWKDLEGEQFAFRWTVSKETIRILKEMRIHLISGTEPSQELLAQVAEYNLSHLCCDKHPNPEYHEYIKFLLRLALESTWMNWMGFYQMQLC